MYINNFGKNSHSHHICVAEFNNYFLHSKMFGACIMYYQNKTKKTQKKISNNFTASTILNIGETHDIILPKVFYLPYSLEVAKKIGTISGNPIPTMP